MKVVWFEIFFSFSEIEIKKIITSLTTRKLKKQFQTQLCPEKFLVDIKTTNHVGTEKKLAK